MRRCSNEPVSWSSCRESRRGPFFAEAARVRGMPIVGDIDRSRAPTDAPVVGITGTNGKSTVTTLVGGDGRRARGCGCASAATSASRRWTC